MGQVNKIPLGFLNMLSSQTGGRNPPEYADSIVPTVEMTPFFHSPALRIVFNNIAVGTGLVNTFHSIPVPENKAWFVYGWAFDRLQALGTDEFQVAFGIGGMTTPGFMALHTSPIVGPGLAIGDRQSYAALSESVIPLTSGMSVQLRFLHVAGTQAAQFQALVAQFDA